MQHPSYRHRKKVHGDDEKDHDGEGEQASVEMKKPSKRRKKEPTGSSAPFTCDEQREVGQHCMHIKWGKCTLLAEALGGWNVRYSSGPTNPRSYYASNEELSAI
jgi:hypothetical protein